MLNLWPGVVNRPHMVKASASAPGIFFQAWGQFSEVAGHPLCPFIPFPLSRYPYFLFVISVSTVPLNSGIKLLTCSNGEQCCPWRPMLAVYAHYYIGVIL